jgi:hypothetical protein
MGYKEKRAAAEDTIVSTVGRHLRRPGKVQYAILAYLSPLSYPLADSALP